MIPDEAVEASADALLKILPSIGGTIPLWALQKAIEAALPYLSEAARQPQRTSPTVWPDVPRRQ